MMIQINYNISLFLILVCGLSCTSNVTFESEKFGTFDQKSWKVDNENAAQILDKYNDFYWALVLSSPRVMYPRYFGGMYINCANDAVILTTDISKENLIKEIAGSDKVIVKQCTYSYNDLLNLDEYIIGISKNRPELFEKIEVSTWGINCGMNCLEVSIVQSTTEKINLFKSRIFDSPMLRFRSDSAFITIDLEKAVKY